LGQGEEVLDAMIETECQKLVTDAVEEARGEGLKLNNRFLVGVVDLLVKLPDCPPMWLEAKLAKFSDKIKPTHRWDVGCTAKQKEFLRDWHRAGMLTGVVSFVQTTGGNMRSLRMALYSYSDMTTNDLGWWAMVKDHKALGDKADRNKNIVDMLREFANANANR